MNQIVLDLLMQMNMRPQETSPELQLLEKGPHLSGQIHRC